MKPSRSVTAREVRALAHPLRLELLEALLNHGPATASMLARRLGESSGATSYHLRALASAGLIDEELDRRKGRERWWKHAGKVGLISSAPAEDAEYNAAVAQLESVMLARDEEGLRRYLHRRSEFTPEWQETAFIGGWGVYATRADVDELSKLIMEWLRAHRAGPGEHSPDAMRVHLTYRCVPQEPPGV